MPHPDRPSGPTPGAAAGCQSPARSHGPSAGPSGLAPRSQPAGEELPTRTDRQGTRFGAATGLRPNSAAAQPQAKAEAIGRDWPTPRLGRWSGATQQAGTDVARTRAAIRGRSTVGPRPAAARLGQVLAAVSQSGRVPATARTASAAVAAGVGRAGLPQIMLKAKGGVTESARRGCQRQSPLGPDPTGTLTVNVTTSKKELKRL